MFPLCSCFRNRNNITLLLCCLSELYFSDSFGKLSACQSAGSVSVQWIYYVLLYCKKVLCKMSLCRSSVMTPFDNNLQFSIMEWYTLCEMNYVIGNWHAFQYIPCRETFAVWLFSFACVSQGVWGFDTWLVGAGNKGLLINIVNAGTGVNDRTFLLKTKQVDGTEICINHKIW